MIVRDGEGATAFAEVRVEGARSEEDADLVARAIAESPSVKTALHGGDPNWGRILAAAGPLGRRARREPGRHPPGRRVGLRGAAPPGIR
jgi:glutamate N-acetyltransferase/amino-acid N-acetyltransferase